MTSTRQKNSLKNTLCVVLFFLLTNNADAKLTPSAERFSEVLRYRGSDLACVLALGHASFHENYFSTFIPKKRLTGEIYLTLLNPTKGTAPINTYLYKSGDADRYGFTMYYDPAQPLFIHHHNIGLRGFIFNICMDGQKQAAIMLKLASNDICVVSTPAWNFCR